MKILSCSVIQFKKDRHEALSSGRETDIRIFSSKYGIVLPHNQEDFWMLINQSIVECEDFTKDQQEKAAWWIGAFGGGNGS